MTAPVFVDTNIWVYARDPSDAVKHTAARRWLTGLWDTSAGRTSIQVLSEYYVTVTRRLSMPLTPDEAWHDLTAMLAWSPRAVDDDVLQQARAIERRHRLNWWDCLIAASAALQDCTTLLTEDLQDGLLISGVEVRNPFRTGVRDELPLLRRATRASRMRSR